jgi:FMN phosphatase YigB (HAD superfamily)
MTLQDYTTNVLIFDLGDVLFSWTPTTSTTVSPTQLKRIMDSPIWHRYECGKIDQYECYQQCAADFDIPVREIYEAFAQARASLTSDDKLVQLIRTLRKERPDLRVYAMSNISVSIEPAA